MVGPRAALFVRKELAGALHARWFVVYAAIFLGAGLLLATFGVGDTVVYGHRGFAKAFTGLVHLALMFVPLMALFPAAASLADERDSGALEYILAQPISSGEVYTGKWGGLIIAMLLSLTIGFGAAGAVAVLRGVPVGLILTSYVFVLLLALAFVALGLVFSAAAGSRARALTFGIVSWFVLVTLGTLGLMLAFVRWGLPERLLVLWTFVNPVEAFRIGVMSTLDPDLSLLGPVGAGIVDRMGTVGVTATAAAILTAWGIAPGVLGWLLFRRLR